MSKIVHFEIHAENPERAVEFYTKVFDWKITKWDGPMEYWMIIAGDEKETGINGGLLRRNGSLPESNGAVNGYVCTIYVDSVDSTLEKIKNAGGSVALPKTEIQGMGWLAYFKDTEGNIFGVMEQNKKS